MTENDSTLWEDNVEFDNHEFLAHVRVVVNIVCGLAALLGIPANIFVLIAIVYFRDMRTISNVYIFNLAVADLLFLTGTPIVVIQSNTKNWIFGSAICKLFICGNGVSQFASAMFIAVLSFDRFLVVCRSTHSFVWRTMQAAFVFSLATWVLVVLEITPLMMFVKLIRFTNGTNEPGNNICMLITEDEPIFDASATDDILEVDENSYMKNQLGIERETLFSKRFFTTYTFTLSYLLPLIAIWFFYAMIIRKLWRRRHLMHLKRKDSKRKTTKVTIIGLSIVISYTLCWLPYWIIQWSIVLNLDWKRNLSILTRASYAAFALLYINRAVNPFIYVLLSESFKKNVSILVYKKSTEKKKRGGNLSESATKMLPIPNNRQSMLTSF